MSLFTSLVSAQPIPVQSAYDYTQEFYHSANRMPALQGDALLQQIGAQGLQAKRDMNICVIDYDPLYVNHPALQREGLTLNAYAMDDLDAERFESYPKDKWSHGTGMVSLIVGHDGPFKGVLHRNKVHLRYVRMSGYKAVKALTACTVNGIRPDVISMSLAWSEKELIYAGVFNALKQKLRALEKQGTLVVSSYGINQYSDDKKSDVFRPYYPASLPTVLSVGGIDAEGFPIFSSLIRYEWSQDKVDVVAPGNNIVVPGDSVTESFYHKKVQGQYFLDKGASQATAMTAGAAALAWSYVPECQPREVRAAFKNTAKPQQLPQDWPAHWSKPTSGQFLWAGTGHGRIHVRAAIKYLQKTCGMGAQEVPIEPEVIQSKPKPITQPKPIIESTTKPKKKRSTASQKQNRIQKKIQHIRVDTAKTIFADGTYSADTVARILVLHPEPGMTGVKLFTTKYGVYLIQRSNPDWPKLRRGDTKDLSHDRYIKVMFPKDKNTGRLKPVVVYLYTNKDHFDETGIRVRPIKS